MDAVHVCASWGLLKHEASNADSLPYYRIKLATQFPTPSNQLNKLTVFSQTPCPSQLDQLVRETKLPF